MRDMAIRIWRKQWLQKTRWVIFIGSQPASSCLLCSLWNLCQSAGNPWSANTRIRNNPAIQTAAFCLSFYCQLFNHGEIVGRGLSKLLETSFRSKEKKVGGKIHYKRIKKELVTSKIIHSFIHTPWVVIQPSHPLNGHEFEQTLGDSEGQGSLVCCSPWGCRVRHNLPTEQEQQ